MPSRACGVSNDLHRASAVSIQGNKVALINAAVETRAYKGVFIVVDHLTFRVREFACWPSREQETSTDKRPGQKKAPAAGDRRALLTSEGA
jgi:hypothetical protein